MTAVAIAFWASVGLLVYAQVGYPLLLWCLVRLQRGERMEVEPAELPRVSVIVAAHDEEASILKWVQSTLAFEYPRELLQVIVASDGSTDHTLEWATKAGADLVLDLPRAGKVAALNAAVARADGELLAFSDANAVWEPDALARLVRRFGDDRVGYVCGQLNLDEVGAGHNQEGLYWRYETAIRGLESRLAGVTAGNGAINAVRRQAYIPLEHTRGHDISLPYELTKRGWRAVYEPAAVAHEPMAATLGSEFRRKRRMLTGAWATILRHGMLSPRGYSAGYALEIFSHRGLRYAAPLLHLIALGTNIALLGQGAIYAVTLGCQLALLVAAALGAVTPLRALRIANYYVAVTAASAAGLWDFLVRGVPTTWGKAEGTR